MDMGISKFHDVQLYVQSVFEAGALHVLFTVLNSFIDVYLNSGLDV